MLTNSPVKWVLGIFFVCMGLSHIIRGWFSTASKFYANGQWKTALEWAVKNCDNKLVISDLEDLSDFQDGCYHFVGELKVQGNLTMPPFPDTTQCNSVVGYNAIQTYGTYLARQCNFNGQNQECNNYNPACAVDISQGLGYEIRNGWLPNGDQFAERWHSLIYAYEFEKFLEQPKDWRKAAVQGEISTYALNYEYCSKLGGESGEESMCKEDFNLPGHSALNNSRTYGYFETFLKFESYEDEAIYVNDPENMPIYDVGQTSGPAIHFNAKAYENIQSSLQKKQRDDLIAWDIQENGAQTRDWLHINPTMTPEDPNIKTFRNEEMVTTNRKFDWYGGQLYYFIHDLIWIKETAAAASENVTASTKFYTPHGHKHGANVYAPNAFGDSFYSDADLETIRNAGTTPRGNPNFIYTDEPISYYPYAMSPTVMNKIRANGGEMTDAELKALPEYGDVAHFPVVTNESYWGGNDNCWYENGHGSEQKYPYGTVKITPTCRVSQPENIPIDFLGMVSKTTNKNTGQPMLVYNPIVFSDENNELSKLEDAHLIKIPDTLTEYNKQRNQNSFDVLVTQWLIDNLATAGPFYGLPWYHNSLNKKANGVFFYLTWYYFTDPQVWVMQMNDPTYTAMDWVRDSYAMANSAHTFGWMLTYSTIIPLVYFFLAKIILDSGEKISSGSNTCN